MNSFDSTILSYFNTFSQHSVIFDKSMVFLNASCLLKAGLLLAALWWAWVKSEKSQSYDRDHIIATLLSCFIAIAVGRALALMLPFRARPIHEVGLNFLLPYGMKQSWLDGWSSFPSDHMVLFCSLCAGLLFISRKLGVLAFLYVALFIAFPRVYLGFHYPTDILAGAVIGVGIGWIGNVYISKSKISKLIVRWSDLKPYYFYPLFFLCTFEVGELFDFSRKLVEGLAEVSKIILTKF
jgi:membrane-associated phospholipid phosphatase